MEKLSPKIVIFDVDGVLVDVRDSYHRTIVETVRCFTGRRVSVTDIHRWKSRSGYNDDWKLTADWIRSLGQRVPFAEVTRVFQQLYRRKKFDGYIRRERWLFARRRLQRMARRAELAVFTGRPRREVLDTLKKFGVRRYFCRIAALEDVKRSKPDPEGLRRILNGRDPTAALYVGDNIDDALAAKCAGIAFVGVLPRGSVGRRLRASTLRRLGARIILDNVNELEPWLR